MTLYTYSISTDFTNANAVNLNTLYDNLLEANITPLRINVEGDNVYIHYENPLSTSDKGILDSQISSYIFYKEVISISPEYDAIISSEGNGDYLKLSDAINDGKKTIFIRNGIYYENGDINIPNGASIIGESQANVVLVFISGSLVIDGSNGKRENAGTVSFSNASNQVVGSGTTFTNVNPGEFITLGSHYYEIKSVESDTALTLSQTYEGRDIVGGSFEIQPMFSGNTLHRFVIIGNGVSPALYVRAMHHGIIRSIATRSSGVGFHFVRCGSVGVYEHIIGFSELDGVFIEESNGISMHTLSIYNSGGKGFRVKNSSDIILSSSLIGNNNGGIDLEASDAIINNSIVRLNKSHGVSIDVNSSANITGMNIINNELSGIESSGFDVSLEGCKITNHANGVRFYGSGSVCGSIIKDCTTGITSGGAVGCIFSDNSISDATTGINISSNLCVVHGNTIKNCTDGIIANNEANLSQNVATSNTTGIRVLASNTTVIACMSINNDVGIYIASGLSGVRVAYSNVRNNTTTDIDDNSSSALSGNSLMGAAI